jgi:hypothetical protein
LRRVYPPRVAASASTLIETAVRRLLDEVPALAPLRLVIGLELRGRGDVQLYRVELPGPKTTKGVAADARVRVSLSRADFNVLAEKGGVREWRAALAHGDVKVTGPDQILRLVANVVDRQEERARTRKARR